MEDVLLLPRLPVDQAIQNDQLARVISAVPSPQHAVVDPLLLVDQTAPNLPVGQAAPNDQQIRLVQAGPSPQVFVVDPLLLLDRHVISHHSVDLSLPPVKPPILFQFEIFPIQLSKLMVLNKKNNY